MTMLLEKQHLLLPSVSLLTLVFHSKLISFLLLLLKKVVERLRWKKKKKKKKFVLANDFLIYQVSRVVQECKQYRPVQVSKEFVLMLE